MAVSSQPGLLPGLLAQLVSLPVFAGMRPETLLDLAGQMDWLALPGGALLFEQDEDPDALYLLLHGRLAVTRRDGEGRFRNIGYVAPGESVGEIGMITGEPRSARVEALRDSELLRLSRPAFEQLLAVHPAAMMTLSRLVLRRSAPARGGPRPMPRCLALVPLQPGLDVAGLARQLARALGADPVAAVIDHQAGDDHDTSWFGQREAASPWLIYVGDTDPAWRERCVHQSDCVLLLADAARPQRSSLPVPASSPHVSQHLVLLQHGAPVAGSTRAWLDTLPASIEWHHLAGADDLARLARRLSGRALGLVLSGGGARGFAHLGVVQALREAGLVFDHVGGTSIGAILGAGVASGWSQELLVENFRARFTLSNPLSDWTLPLVALRGGRKVTRLLQEAFGELDVEDLPLPFFCVSTDLAAGVLAVHHRGPLWRWLRATCAIPGVLPPVFADGRILVDGGVLENLPVAEMRRRLPGEVVAVDVSGGLELKSGLQEDQLPPWWHLLPELFGVRKRPGILQILLRAGMVNSDATRIRRRRQTRLLIRPPLDGIDLLGWRSFERAVTLGYEQTLRTLEEEPAVLDALRKGVVMTTEVS